MHLVGTFHHHLKQTVIMSPIRLTGSFGTRRPRRAFTPYKPTKPRPEPRSPSVVTPIASRAMRNSATYIDPVDRQILAPKSVARRLRGPATTGSFVPYTSATANTSRSVLGADHASHAVMANDSTAAPATPGSMQFVTRFWNDNLAPSVSPVFFVAANGLTRGIKRAADVASK